MKKLITLLLALAMVLSLAACGSKDTPAPDGQNTPAATYKIKCGTTGNEEHQSTIAANFFKEKVEELTNGAVTVEIYPNSQLGSEREMVAGCDPPVLYLYHLSGRRILRTRKRAPEC